MEYSYCDIDTDVAGLGAFTPEQLGDSAFRAKLERQIVIASQRVKGYTRHEWWDAENPDPLAAIPVVVREATAIIAARACDRVWDPESGEARRLIIEKNDTHAYELSELGKMGVSTGWSDTDEMLLMYRKPRRSKVFLGMPVAEEVIDEPPVDA